MTLPQMMRHLDTQVPPCEAFPGGILTEASGEPDAAASPFFLVYIDTDTDKVYFDPLRSGDWQEIAAAADLGLTPGDNVLTATP